MRKIKLTEEKKREEKEEYKKIKNMVIVKSLSDDQVKKNFELSKVIMCLSLFGSHLRNTFNLKETRTKKLSRFGGKSLQLTSINDFRNDYFWKDYFKNEFIYFLIIHRCLEQISNATYENLTYGMSIIKNKKLLNETDRETAKIFEKYMIFLAEYIKDIMNDKIAKYNVINFISLVAICEVFNYYLKKCPKEDLLIFFNDKDIKVLKGALTKVINSVPYILKFISGRDYITEFKVKTILEQFGNTTYNVKEMLS